MRKIRMQRRVSTVLGALVLASCGTGLHWPRLPQIEQATEATHGGGERYRVHRTCSSTAQSVDALIACMRAADWDFLARGPGHPEAECWEARDRGELDHIPPLCFSRSPEHPKGTP